MSCAVLQDVMFGSFYPHEVAELFRTEVQDLEVDGLGGEEKGKGRDRDQGGRWRRRAGKEGGGSKGFSK